jgi:hypothetical protein
MESHPLRVVAMGPNDTLVSVHRELGHRGSAILVWDRTLKVVLVSQSASKIARVISRLVDAGVLDPWQKVYPQGIYGLLRHQIKSNTHKGWLAERCSLQEAPRRLALVRKEGHAQAAIVCSYPQLWEVTRGEAG